MSEYIVDFTEEEEKTLISNLHAMLSPFVLQRTKADVLSLEALPPRKEVILRIPLSSGRRRHIKALKIEPCGDLLMGVVSLTRCCGTPPCNCEKSRCIPISLDVERGNDH